MLLGAWGDPGRLHPLALIALACQEGCPEEAGESTVQGVCGAAIRQEGSGRAQPVEAPRRSHLPCINESSMIGGQEELSLHKGLSPGSTLQNAKSHELDSGDVHSGSTLMSVNPTVVSG